MADIATATWEKASLEVAAMLSVPSTSTWSRSRHRSSSGPPPLRNAAWPWGFPWLEGKPRQAVDASNDELRTILGQMATLARSNTASHIVLVHPEDFGGCGSGRPASIWRLPELRVWAKRWGLKRYATFQCRFGECAHSMPVGVLSSYPLDGRLFYPGWPPLGGSDASHYLGPLPKRCGCNDHWSSERTPADQRLRAVGDSILQPGFASYLAALLLRACGSASSITELLRKGAGLGVSERVCECEDHSDVETNCDETSSEEPYHQDRDQLRTDEGQTSAVDQLALQSLGLWDLMDGVYGNFGGNSDDFENGGSDDFGEDRNSEGKVNNTKK